MSLITDERNTESTQDVGRLELTVVVVQGLVDKTALVSEVP